MSITRKSFNTFFLVGFMTFLAKMAIVLKELAVACRYGRRDELDAFLIALLVPSFVASLLGNAMNAAVIPVYVQLKEKEGNKAAQELFAGVSFLAVCVIGIIALAIWFTAPLFLPGIASGFTGSKMALTFHLLFLLIPFVILSGITALWSAVINAQEQFKIVVLSPIISPLVIVVLLLLFPAYGIRVIAYGTLVGIVLEMAVLGVALRRRGLSLWPRWRGWSLPLRGVIRQFLPAITGSLLMGSTLLVDQAMATRLAPGSVAALSYGNKLIGFSLALLTTTMGTILTPYFSKKVIDTTRRDLFRLLSKYLMTVFPFAVLLSLTITLFSHPLIRLIFYRGAFTLADVQLVAGVQSWLAWQIPFYIGAVILTRLIAAMRMNWILAGVAGFNVVANIVLNYWLMQRMGIYGIALSTTLVYVLSFLLLLFFICFSKRKPG